MTRFLMDTGIAGDYINRRRGVFDRARNEMAAGNRIGIGVPVLAELAYCVALSKSRDRNLQSLRAARGALKLWPFDEKAAWEYGRLAADLRRLGRPMQVGRHDDRRHRLHARRLHRHQQRFRFIRRAGIESRELGNLISHRD